MEPPADDTDLGRALERWERLAGAVAEPFGGGLINRTWRVRASGADFVLQRVNPIFDPAIHDNIAAVTERLAERGLPTPRLVADRAAGRYADLGPGGVWRLITFVPGVSFDVVGSPAQARAAAAFVARFHSALNDLPHRFAGLRLGVHDTPRHLATLRDALAAHTGHRLFPAVRALGEAILAAAPRLAPLPTLAPRIGHGDLEFNNVLFAGHGAPASVEAVCLVDLDTVGPMALAFELGDAWRSWCNPHGEDREDALFDLEVYAASLDGYLGALGRSLAPDERSALLGGVEWISLELAARFAADALNERYFGWDPTRFAGRGEHNLVRARSQWTLHEAVMASRRRRATLLGL